MFQISSYKIILSNFIFSVPCQWFILSMHFAEIIFYIAVEDINKKRESNKNEGSNDVKVTLIIII